MKKLLLIPVLAFLVSVSALAQVVPTSTSRITLSTDGKPDMSLDFLLHSTFKDGWDNTYDAVAANPGGIYVYSDGERYTTWASNAYTEGLAIGFGTGSSTTCTLKFSNFSGTSYTIYDLVAAYEIQVNGSTPDYTFSIEAGQVNSTINNRFVVNYTVPEPPAGTLQVCFTGTVLQITSNTMGNIVVKKKATGTQVGSYPQSSSSIIMNTANGYSDGDYIVEVGTGADKRSFIVTVKN